MAAEPIGMQSALEFLVAVFTFPALDVCVVSGLGKNRRTGKQPSTADPKSVERRAVEKLSPSVFILGNRPTVCSLCVGFALDDCITCTRPRTGLIPERAEHALFLAGLLEVFDRLLQ